VTVTAG